MSPLHSSNHRHWHIHSPQPIQHAKRPFVFQAVIQIFVSTGHHHVLNLILSGVKTFARSKGLNGL